MEYVLLFLTDGVMGYLLQGVGYLLGIYAFVRREIKAREFIPMAVAYGVVAFGIRQIGVISFGFHTILIMITIILMAVLLLKTPAFMTVLGVLSASVAILLSEIVNISILNGILGHERMAVIMAGDGTISGEISKAVAGIPTNLILVAVMFIFYRLRMKKLKESSSHGATGSQVGAEDRNGTER